MTITFPAAPPKPRPMALDLLAELELISSQAEAVAADLRRLNLDPVILEQLQPGAGATAQQIVCQLETAADAVRGMGQ
ncbi:MAG: hypothetical protein KGO47_07305 [Cyanobacteria bacterium REEB417]|nr:hypothetical protein [Cyanobacteria bacterium REEB417]